MLLKLITRINFVADCITAATFIIMTVGVLIAVLGRYFFRYPMPSGMEATYYAMLWCAFLQTGKALFEDKHVNMPFLIDRLSRKSNALFNIIVNLIILVTAFFMSWYAVSFTRESIILKWRSSGALAVPMFLLYGIMALGILYLGIVCIYKIIESGKLMKKGKFDGC